MSEVKYKPVVGIIGVGFLGQCLVEGLSKLNRTVILSPRNLTRTADLSNRLNCKVAQNNSDVVAQSDLVFLATLPKDIVTTAKNLPWRKNQSAVSVAAGIGLPAIKAAVQPAKVFRAMPISAVRLLRGPTAFYPNDKHIFQLFNDLGSAHPLNDEKNFEIASIFGALYGYTHALIDEASNWAELHGLNSRYSRVLVSRMLSSAAANVIENTSDRPRKILDDLLTTGGITEAGLKVLDLNDGLQKWRQALTSSLNRSRQLE